MRARFLFAGAVLAASCALPSVEEFAGGGAAPTPDGGGVADGAVSPASDGSSALDADLAADAPAQETGSEGCPADYCNSFPTAASLVELASEMAVENGGTLAVEDGQLHAFVPARGEGAPPNASVARIISLATRRAVLELDFRIDHGDYTGLTGNAAFLAVDMIASSYANIEVYVGPTLTQVVPLPENGVFVVDTTAPNVPRGKTVHARFEFDLDPVHGAYKLWFDGAVVASRTEFAFGNAGQGKLRITLGLLSVNPSTPAFDVRYDNVVVDLQ